MDLDLSPEHVLLRTTVRAFMENEVAGIIDEHEREHRFPTEIVHRLGAMGWLGIPVPEEDGGAGMGNLAYAIAVEEISRVWGSLGIIVAAHTSLGCGPLMIAGTADQKERFLRPMAAGEVIGAYGLTEPGAGSDATRIQTKATRREGGGWVINGRKHFITGGAEAEFALVFAVTDSAKRAQGGITAFLVDADSPGYSVTRVQRTMSPYQN
ncbi:MAG TPA: acyl-CoA dehydrogenase family protein, partial [Candidatus Limnocylindrales bacterium]